MNSTEIIAKLAGAGWKCTDHSGDDFSFEHKDKPYPVTIKHPVYDNQISYIRRIEKATGVKLL